MSFPWPLSLPTAAHREAYLDAAPHSYWLEHAGAPEPSPALQGHVRTDVCIVGGGFTGLWAALHAKADDPEREVDVLEAETVGYGASGRNGGFVSASLTHGIANGIARFPDEIDTLERLGRENYDGFCSDLATHQVDCDLETTGELTVALGEHEVPWLDEEAELLRRFGHDVELLGQRCGPRSARRSITAGSGTGPAPHSSTRESSPSACAPLPLVSGSGSTSEPRRAR